MKTAKVTLIYDAENGTALTDAECQRMATNLATFGGEFTFANELFFNYFRLQVKYGAIFPENVEVTFNDGKQWVRISLNADGRCDYWPKGFCDKMDDILNELVFGGLDCPSNK